MNKWDEEIRRMEAQSRIEDEHVFTEQEEGEWCSCDFVLNINYNYGTFLSILEYFKGWYGTNAVISSGRKAWPDPTLISRLTEGQKAALWKWDEFVVYPNKEAYEKWQELGCTEETEGSAVLFMIESNVDPTGPSVVTFTVEWNNTEGRQTILNMLSELFQDVDLIEKLECHPEIKTEILKESVMTFPARSMPEFQAALEDFQEYVYAVARSKGRWRPEVSDITTKLALLHAEVSEVTEAVRRGNRPDEHIPEFKGAEAELADIVIMSLEIAKHFGFNLFGAMVAKAKYNETRPYMNGEKKF